MVVPQNDPEKDIDRKLKADPDLFLIGIVNGEVAASAIGGYEGHRGWINYLAVSPSHLRNGYGRLMMQAIETKLLQKGYPKINLQVRSSNQSVIEFYAARGYGTDEVVSLGKRSEYD